jgi:hypothetical protein
MIGSMEGGDAGRSPAGALPKRCPTYLLPGIGA